jgi:putative oxidoreductase
MGYLQSAAAVAGRLLLAWLFLFEGAQKLGSYSAVGAYMEAHQVSARLLPLVILAEIGGGGLIALGLFTRLTAVGLATFCVLTALLFHANFANGDELIHFNKDIAIAGGFVVLAAFGAGSWSLDGLWRRTI